MRKSNLPNFLIIGAQKSGTTWVQNCMMAHPQVFLPEGEVAFFEDPDYCQTGLEKFKKIFENVDNGKTIGIKRPNYLAKAACPERIYKHIPHAKLIVLLRNPLERAISAYFHYMRYGFIPIKDIEQGMRKVVSGCYEDLHLRAKEIIDFGFYYRHLKHYLHFFDRKQMLIMLFDDMQKEPAEFMKRIYRFLEIDDGYAPKCLGSRPQSGIYSLARLRMIALKNRLMYRYNTEKTRLYAKESMRYSDKSLILASDLIDRSLVSKFAISYPPKISADLKKELALIYREDIAQLEKLLGKDLTNWI